MTNIPMTEQEVLTNTTVPKEYSGVFEIVLSMVVLVVGAAGLAQTKFIIEWQLRSFHPL